MKKLLFLIITSFCVNLLLSCSGIAAEPIKIAAIFAKTGVTAEEDVYAFPVIRMIVEDINKEGGILGRLIEIIELDNKSSAIGAKEAAQEAVGLGVVAVIGSSWSTQSLGMAPVLQKANVVMITPLSTNPQVTKIGNYIFRVCFTDPSQGSAMSEFAVRELKAKTAAIITNIGNDYSLSLADSFRTNFMQKGLKIVYEGKYVEHDADFTAIVNDLTKIGPDVIFVPGHDKDSALIIKQARKMGIKAIFLGGDGWSPRMYEIVGDAIEGNYYSSYWHPEVSFSKGKELQAEYYKKFGKEIIGDQVLVYDAVFVLVDAIKRAQSLQPSKIREALAATKDLEAASGAITYAGGGDPINKDIVILKFGKQKISFVKSFKP